MSGYIDNRKIDMAEDRRVRLLPYQKEKARRDRKFRREQRCEQLREDINRLMTMPFSWQRSER